MVKTTTALEERVKTTIRDPENRNEAIRLSREMHGFVQPLLDWYQFKSPDNLARYIVEICDDKALRMTLPKAREQVTGRLKYTLDDALRWQHSTMRRMLQAAEEGMGEQIRAIHRFKYLLPNQQPLRVTIETAINEFIGVRDPKIVESIERALSNTKAVNEPTPMIARLQKAYGFFGPAATNKFLADFAGIPSETYHLRPVTGNHTFTSNYHRKMFAVGLVLEYALSHGFKEHAVAALLRREKKGAPSKGRYSAYLGIPSVKYMELIKLMERKGLRGHILAFVMSQVMDMSIKNAKRTYIKGNVRSMNMADYLKLQEFAEYALPNIGIVDLSDSGSREEGFKRALSYQNGSRVLIVYIGPEDSRVNDMVRDIMDRSYARLILPVIFDPKKSVKVEGLVDYKELMAFSKYSLEKPTFKSPR